jgi:hypothetical protein
LTRSIRDALLRIANAAWPLLATGCDAGAHSIAMDAGTGAESVFACSVPASAPSQGSCIMTSSSMIACNPVTNQPCTSSQTCRVTVDSSQNLTGFACATSDGAGLCAPCSDYYGPVCAGGLACTVAVAPASACARYCCTNDDCGDAGVCAVTDGNGTQLFGSLAPNLGVCALAVDAGQP